MLGVHLLFVSLLDRLALVDVPLSRFLFSLSSASLRYLNSFPTRRSSDLVSASVNVPPLKARVAPEEAVNVAPAALDPPETRTEEPGRTVTVPVLVHATGSLIEPVADMLYVPFLTKVDVVPTYAMKLDMRV